MASNSFGNIFKITTWGESHGKAIGVVIDGCPAGLSLSDKDIQQALDKRAPGKTPLTSPRSEPDKAEILSGVFEGRTTGTPISILIPNRDADSSRYEAIKGLLRPSHANFTYLEKYGIFDYRGGGRSSARETACRVAAGAVAKKLLKHFDIQVSAFLQEVGSIRANIPETDLERRIDESPIFCPDPQASDAIMAVIEEAKKEKDSLGGIVGFLIKAPAGLGDPIYEKLEANLAHAMMTIPATKGVEIGSGFHAASMKGSQHNDPFIERHRTGSNHAGGILGGISTGMPIIGGVVFKPTSSIARPQQTVSVDGEPQIFQLPEGSRHDPCVAIRGVPVVEAMAALVLVDALLLHRSSKI